MMPSAPMSSSSPLGRAQSSRKEFNWVLAADVGWGRQDGGGHYCVLLRTALKQGQPVLLEILQSLPGETGVCLLGKGGAQSPQQPCLASHGSV